MRSAIAQLDGKVEFSPKFVDALFKCTLCGGCDIKCKRNLDVEVLQVIETSRAKCIEAGKGPMPEHKVMAETISRTKNKYGAPHEDRLKWIGNVKPAPKADILYFVGCASAYKQPKLARNVVELLNCTGTQFMLSEDEWCCGHPLFSTGQVELARATMEHNIKAIEDSGARIVITGDADCYKTLKVDYPKLLGCSTEDMPYTVLHIVEYFDQLMKEGKIKFTKTVPIKVTYHDPCNLGRLGEPWYHWEPKYLPPNIAVDKIWRRGEKGVYQPPRDILKAIPGINLVEMERIKDNAWCCGSGGGVEVAFPDFASWIAGERIEEAKTTGAEAVVTCCPSCKEALSKQAKIKGNGMAVYDITELMLRAI
jgi:Fe-S oxidoreductase